MSKMCVIGEEEFIFCFSAMGLAIFPVTTEEEAEEALKKAVAEGYSIIYLTETYLYNIESNIEKIIKNQPVSVLIIPGTGKAKNLGWEKLRKTVEKAIGADLLKD